MGNGREQEKTSTPNEYLRQARLQRRWTQQDLADEVGTTIANVSRWERGITVPGPYFRQQLCAVLDLQANAVSGTLTKPTEDPLFWNVPFCRNPLFIGRQDVLLHLHALLNADNLALHPKLYALSGLGGMGKTQTAIEYAYQFRQQYQAVLWVPAERYETIISGLATLADLLQVPERDEDDQHLLARAVARWFRDHHKWLLIFDNMDDFSLIGEILPDEHQGHILFTTRSQSTGAFVQNIDLPPLDCQESIFLLLRRAKLISPETTFSDIPSAMQETASALAEMMAGLPLALDQAGAYIEETGCSLADYLEHYQRHNAPLLNRRGNSPIDHAESVQATLLLCFKKAQKVHPATMDLLRLCSCLHSHGIPEEMISAGASYLGHILQPVVADPIILDEVIGTLRRYSLLHRDRKTKTFTVHRLVRSVLQSNMEPPEQQRWAVRAIQVVNQVFPDAENADAWPVCQRYLHQALVCIQLTKQQAIVIPEAGQLSHHVGKYLRERALYVQAQSLLQMALEIRLRISGDDHLDVAETLYELAWCYKEQGRFVEAEPLLHRALAVYEQQVGLDHPYVADCFNNLAMLYREQGRFAEAIPLLRQAAAIWERQDSQASCIANVLNNLAVLYHDLGHTDQAEALFLRVVSMYERQENPAQHRVARGIMNLGVLYRDQGRYGEAEALLLQALAIREQVLGTEHPHTAITLHDLATLYQAQGEYNRADPLYRQALGVQKLKLGTSHPETRTTAAHLAELHIYAAANRDSE